MSKANRPPAIFVVHCEAGDHVYFARQLSLWSDRECDHCAAGSRLGVSPLDEAAWRVIVGLQAAWVEDQKVMRQIVSLWGWREQRHGAAVVVTPRGIHRTAGRVLEGADRTQGAGRPSVAVP